MHLYAPGVKGYIPIDWQMADSKAVVAASASCPPSHMLNLPVIKEIVPVYDQNFRITRDIVIGQENEIAPLIGPDRTLTVEATFKYQACDDKECYLPEIDPAQVDISCRQTGHATPACGRAATPVTGRRWQGHALPVVSCWTGR